MSSKSQRFQAVDAFKLGSRMIVKGEVIIIPEGEGRLYVTRGQLVKLSDTAAPPVAADGKPPKGSKPRASGKASPAPPDAPPEVIPSGIEIEPPAASPSADEASPSVEEPS